MLTAGTTKLTRSDFNLQMVEFTTNKAANLCALRVQVGPKKMETFALMEEDETYIVYVHGWAKVPLTKRRLLKINGRVRLQSAKTVNF